MAPPKNMQTLGTDQAGLEQQRADFVRTMETMTPREVLEAIEHVVSNTPRAASEWPELITQTHGACYAS